MDEIKDTITEQEVDMKCGFEVDRAYGAPYGKYINRLDTKFFDSDEYRQTLNVSYEIIEGR